MKHVWFAGVAVAALLAGCWGGDDDAHGSGKVLARVNGAPIYESQLNAQLAGIPADLLKGREGEATQQILEALIQQQVITQEAKKQKVKSDPLYQEQMKHVEKQLAVNVLMAKKVSETVTQAAVAAAYEAQKASMGYPAVKAKHILVKTRAEAVDLIKIANPANFSELARQKSTGPTKDNGGDLGWFKKDMMVPAFAAVAFSTPVGTVAAQPVETPFGWHVILVEGREERHVPALAEVEAQIKQQLSQEVVQGFLKDLRQSAKVEYSDGMAPAAK